MATDVKWIKIATDVFDNRKIRRIEKMPEGDTLLVIWFKLLCLAGKINDSGLIYITREVPYTAEDLADYLNRPLDVTRLALAAFEKLGMIEIVDDILMLPSWEKYQNIDGMDKIRAQNRERKRRERERQKLLLTQGNSELPSPENYDDSHDECHVTVTHGHATDIEEDKEEDIDNKNNNSSKEHCSDTGSNVPNNTHPIVPKREKKVQEDKPAEPPVFELKLNDKSMYPIYASDVAHYRALYPAVDVPQEFRNMIGWIDANPEKRKTKSGIKRFVNSWLARKQNEGGYSQRPPQQKGKYIPVPASIPAEDDDSNPFRR